MRSQVAGTADLSRLRAEVRTGLVDQDVPEDVVDDFVLAVDEVVASALAVSERQRGNKVDVRWSARRQPRCELRAEIRLLGDSPGDLAGDALRARIVRATEAIVVVDELLGGSAVGLRRAWS